MKLSLYNVFESMDAKRKIQGSADDYEKRRNKKIIKDTVNSIIDSEYQIPEKIKNEFYNDIAHSEDEDEKNQAAVELGNSIINSIGNYKNKKSIKNYYSVIIEKSPYYSTIIRTMIFEKFKKFNSKVPFYKFNIRLREHWTEHKERTITSWKCYIRDMTLQIPLFARQLNNNIKTTDNLQIVIHEADEQLSHNGFPDLSIPSINRYSYVQLISEAKLLVSPEFYDFICKLSSVTISEKIIERLRKTKIRFHTGIFDDIITRMIAQKFPKIFHRLIDIEDADMQTRNPKLKKIEIFLKDYLLNQMYGNRENTQNDSVKMIVESMNAKRKIQGSADDYEKRRNKKIIKDTVTQLSPIAMDYRMLSEESLDEFTDYILQRYIKSNPYIKDFAKEDNPYNKDIKYININFKTQQNSCDYRIRMNIESLCLSWASDIMKSNDLNIEHTFNTPFRMEVCCFSDPTKSDNYIPKYDYLNSTDGTYSFKNPYEIIETINKHFLIDLELQLNLIRIAVCPSTVAVRHYYLTNDPGKITRMIVQNYVNIAKSSVIPLISGMLDGISFLLYMFPDNIRAKMVKGYLKNATNSNHLTEQSYNILFNEYEKYFAGYRKKIAGEFSTEFPLL